MMMASPVVSIYMPIFNGGKYVAETLESLLLQTYSFFEIIIVDDGSTDNSAQIIKQFAERDSRIRVVTHPQNLGLSAARNTGWKSAHESSKYFLNHDCDDISLPHKLESLVMFLDRHAEISAVGSFCRYIDEHGADVGFPPLEWKPKRIRQTFGRFNSMAISATLVRRPVFDVIEEFRPEYGGCDDYDFWSRLLLHGFHLANIPQFLHKIRIHSSSFSSVHGAQMNKQALQIQDNYKAHRTDSVNSEPVEIMLHKLLKYRMLFEQRTKAGETMSGHRE